jgi:hypothetical protein
MGRKKTGQGIDEQREGTFGKYRGKRGTGELGNQELE